MKRVALTGALIVLFLALGNSFLIGRGKRMNITPSPANNAPLTAIPLHPMFYEQNSFNQAINHAQTAANKKNINAVIVPHHLLAGNYIAELIKMATKQNLTTVAIVGPNHYNVGASKIASALVAWQTADSSVEVDSELTQKFLEDFSLYSQPNIFINEHSVGAIIPFVHYYAPQAKILPIVLSSNATLEEAKKTAAWLEKNLPPDSLIIGSIDFSHYLSQDKAERHDAITKEVILERAYERIALFNNDYADSPMTLATLLLYAQQTGLTTNILHHGNSNDFALNPALETTSYFAITFGK